jgi:PAS domain S-box-containing protein
MSSCDLQTESSWTKGRSAGNSFGQVESLFRAITENVEDLIMLMDEDRKWRYASPSHLSGLGYAAEDLLGKHALCLIHPDDRALAERTFEDILKDGRGRVVAVRCLHKNGSLRHFESRGALLRGATGQSDGIVVVSRIIDDRILTEQKLHAAHAETELFLQSIPSILIGLDHQGHITHWNPAASRILGLSGKEAIGRLINDCGVKWLHPKMAQEVSQWLQTETAHSSDSVAYERQGQVRFLGLTVRPICAREDGPRRFLITGADVTERKTLEAQLHQTQKLEAIGQLAAGIAHEINTPTQYVGDNTRFLKESWDWIARLLELSRTMCQQSHEKADSDQHWAEFEQLAEQADLEYLLKEVPRAIDQSLDGVQRVAKIVAAMKEFSHPGAEEKRAIDINRAIETTINVARHEWKYVADVVTDFAQDLPPVPCLIGEFNQVILNLLINATHAIAAAVAENLIEKGTITISTRRDGPWSEVTIRDTGTGIGPGIQARIFEPFFTTKPVGKGTGQGLALAHSVIVNRHQGQIWFESAIGKGTTFFIRLPLELRPSVS